jgi:pimeloyl-ACP methyl ester carboxylesterase
MPRANNGPIELEYQIDGPPDAAAVVLSTGFGDQLTFWPEALTAPLIAGGYRLIRFDTRDAGLSSAAKDYGLDDMMSDLLAVADAAGADTFHVIGYSMGGQIALRAALHAPERVRSLALLFTTSGAPGLSPPQPGAIAASMALGQRLDPESAIAATTALIREISGSLCPFDPAAAEETARASIARAYRPEGASRHLAAMVSSPPIHDRLRAITCPALVIQASEDCFFGCDHGEDLSTRLGAPLLLIEGAGHDLAPSVARAFADPVRTLFYNCGAGHAQNR